MSKARFKDIPKGRRIFHIVLLVVESMAFLLSIYGLLAIMHLTGVIWWEKIRITGIMRNRRRMVLPSMLRNRQRAAIFQKQSGFSFVSRSVWGFRFSHAWSCLYWMHRREGTKWKFLFLLRLPLRWFCLFCHWRCCASVWCSCFSFYRTEGVKNWVSKIFPRVDGFSISSCLRSRVWRFCWPFMECLRWCMQRGWSNERKSE